MRATRSSIISSRRVFQDSISSRSRTTFFSNPSISYSCDRMRASIWVASASRSRWRAAATRSGDGGTARARSSRAASAGTTPTSAQASVAASSTSSQRASFSSSDQIACMAGRE